MNPILWYRRKRGLYLTWLLVWFMESVKTFTLALAKGNFVGVVIGIIPFLIVYATIKRAKVARSVYYTCFF